MSLKDEKALLRRRFREKRKDYVAQEGPAAIERVHANMRRWLRDCASPRTQVCLYRPKGDEVDPRLGPLTEYFFPRVEKEELHFLKPKVESAFAPNQWQIEEPVATSSKPLVDVKETVVFCPALAVDGLGRRLGQGRGYYDRFFAAHPKAIRVGVVYHGQFSQDPLPSEGWDQALDWVITDKVILRSSRRSF